MSEIDTIKHMPALDYLRGLPDNSIHCCVTSPPYYGLRDYSADGQIGLEDTPAAYVARLVEVFEEVRRVLRTDGTCWINLGDSYNSAGGTHGGGKHVQNRKVQAHGLGRVPGLKPKDLIGIPWRVAFALQDAGWWLRSDIIWHKPNPMPENVTDRPTKAHEYVFLLTKSVRYFYDANAIREPNSPGSVKRFGITQNGQTRKWDTDDNKRDNRTDGTKSNQGFRDYVPQGRNKRTVWTVATEPSSIPHFAMFPQALIEPMILAGCPATVCSECGAGYVRVVERESHQGPKRLNDPAPYTIGPMERLGKEGKNHSQFSKSRFGDNVSKTLSFSPSCTCNAAMSAGITLDPFMGTGTTALVAKKHGRHWLGCDINSDTVDLANARIQYHGEDKRMIKEAKASVRQMDMFE